MTGMNDIDKQYESVFDILHDIKEDISDWTYLNKGVLTWYRGQDVDNPPLPKLFRDCGYDEFEITRTFRNRAYSFDYRNIPETERLEKWLSLMQHYKALTRLLDWTESPLLALLFAVKDCRNRENPKPTLWVLNPLQLNELSRIDCLPNTWTRIGQVVPQTGEKMNLYPGIEHFRLSFHPKNELKKRNINTYNTSTRTVFSCINGRWVPHQAP
jgi:hypothetical protein